MPGKSHGQRSLAGYSPWGHKRVGYDLATKQQNHHQGREFSLSGNTEETVILMGSRRYGGSWAKRTTWGQRAVMSMWLDTPPRPFKFRVMVTATHAGRCNGPSQEDPEHGAHQGAVTHGWQDWWSAFPSAHACSVPAVCSGQGAAGGR